MLKKLVTLYSSQDFAGVVAIHEANPLVVKHGLQALLIVAQSYYRLNRPEKAGPIFLRAALAEGPPRRELLQIAFTLLQKSENIELAMQAATHLLAIEPRHQEAETFRRHFLPYLARFDEVRLMRESVLASLVAGDAFSIACELPLDHLGWCADEAVNARISDPKLLPFSATSRAQRHRLPTSQGKIRVGYLSNDFSTDHATMILFRAVIEAHDPAAFDIHLFCYTPEGLRRRDNGFRNRLRNLVDIGSLDDSQAVALIRSYRLDIVVDLKGHTFDARAGLLNQGLAPVQVAFLGFPGSGTGIDCDYVIGDRVVTPDSSKPHYHEKFCRLPDSYQPNDNVYRPLPQPMRRSDAGLPSDKFVFASFNAIRKVTPAVFDLWMHILKAVPESVLWTLCGDSTARRNILLHASRAGIAEERIVFAKNVEQKQHIARLQCASLGLDTFPYNGHTTTSDKLWAGLPVVTVRGKNFASRVSESLLQAVGLGELVAEDFDDYVKLAVRLAHSPAELEGLRRKLLSNRTRMPLFDTQRYTRHIESAFMTMAQRCRRGEAPDHFDVPALPAPAQIAALSAVFR
jgi:predicted O-linked N-acetylglucosamine transferase (SPINDLY family)